MRKIKRILIFTLILVQFSSVQAYSLKTDVLSSGGTKMTSSGYILQGTLSQLTASSPWLTSSNYKAIIGFWNSPYASGIKEKENLPTKRVFKNFLYQNKPNPAFCSTEIRYSISQKEHVLLVVYNVLGQKVRTLVNKEQEPGEYRIVWDFHTASRRGLSNGVYFYRIITKSFTQTKKMVILR